MSHIKRTEPIQTVPEIHALLHYLRDWNRNYYIAAMIAIDWGLRCSDVLALKIGDVIAGTGKRIQIADRIVIVEQKTGKRRHITIQDKMKDNLHDHIKARRKKNDVLDLSTPLVLSQKRTPDNKPKTITRQHMSSVINKAAKAVGIRGSIGTHGLRKTFVYQAWKQGVNVDVLQKILGHTSVADTHRYASIPMSFEDEVYKKINFGLQPGTKKSAKTKWITTGNGG
mgnify:CR=1 FL=1